MSFAEAKQRIDEAARQATKLGADRMSISVSDWALMSLLIGQSARLKDGLDAIRETATRQHAGLQQMVSSFERLLSEGHS